MKGTIKTLTDRGYGFIAPESGDDDLFFHANNLLGVEFDRLQVGDEVEFEVTESDKGPNAVDVSPAASEEAEASEEVEGEEDTEEAIV